MAERDRDAEGLRLQVANARPEDAGRGIARLGRESMERLGIREGEPIEIVGRRHTAAIALPPYPEDEGLSLIRPDGLQRHNAGAGSGDHVELQRAEVRPAKRIVLAPAQRNLRLEGSGEALKRTFARRPFTAGDVISTSVHSRRSVQDRRIPDELRPAFEEARKESRASVSPEREREYEELKRSLKQEGPLRQPIGFRASG